MKAVVDSVSKELVDSLKSRTFEITDEETIEILEKLKLLSVNDRKLSNAIGRLVDKSVAASNQAIKNRLSNEQLAACIANNDRWKIILMTHLRIIIKIDGNISLDRVNSQ